MFIALLAISAGSTAQSITVDFSAGPTGSIGSTYTDPTTGLQALGLWCNGVEPGCAWIPANLWRSNNGVDKGLGVCDPSEGTRCTTGTVDSVASAFFELSDKTAPELIELKLPTGYYWVSVTLASLDDNSTDGGPPPEGGQLWSDVDTTPNNGNAVLITTYNGSSTPTGAPFTIPIPPAFASSPYLFFEPTDITGNNSTNNDHLVYKVTLTNQLPTTTTTTMTTTTTIHVTTTTHAPTTTTSSASSTTTTTTPACDVDTDCDDADACTVDHCDPDTGCVHDPVTSSDDLDRQSPACVDQPVPASVGKQFARGCGFIEDAAGQTPKKATKLLSKATRAFKQASKAAAHAATRKQDPISTDCAAELHDLLSGALNQH